MNGIEELESRLARLETKLNRSKLMLLAGMAGIALASCAAMAQQEAPVGVQSVAPQIIRTRGIIIEDEAGRPRILIGAPAPTVAGRTRKDALSGIVYIDENGADRVTLGAEPDPMTVKGIVPRRTGAAGILIHDKEGIERGGYAVLDDGMALLTLDWPKTGEGIALMSNNQFSAMSVYNHSAPGVYRQALMLGTLREDGGGFITLNNGDGKQRMTLQAEGTKAPELLGWNREGKELFRRDIK